MARNAFPSLRRGNVERDAPFGGNPVTVADNAADRLLLYADGDGGAGLRAQNFNGPLQGSDALGIDHPCAYTGVPVLWQQE